MYYLLRISKSIKSIKKIGASSFYWTLRMHLVWNAASQELSVHSTMILVLRNSFLQVAVNPRVIYFRLCFIRKYARNVQYWTMFSAINGWRLGLGNTSTIVIRNENFLRPMYDYNQRLCSNETREERNACNVAALVRICLFNCSDKFVSVIANYINDLFEFSSSCN